MTEIKEPLKGPVISEIPSNIQELWSNFGGLITRKPLDWTNLYSVKIKLNDSNRILQLNIHGYANNYFYSLRENEAGFPDDESIRFEWVEGVLNKFDIHSGANRIWQDNLMYLDIEIPNPGTDSSRKIWLHKIIKEENKPIYQLVVETSLAGGEHKPGHNFFELSISEIDPNILIYHTPNKNINFTNPFPKVEQLMKIAKETPGDLVKKLPESWRDFCNEINGICNQLYNEVNKSGLAQER